MRPLRIVVYDRTCTGRSLLPGLSHAWMTGAKLYASRGEVDHTLGVASWDEAFQALDALEPERPIAEIQYWGHGRWGRVVAGRQSWDTASMREGNLARALSSLARRLTPDALVWFRTCEAFGGEPGHSFARSVADTLGVRVAGHTYVIGFWQSGLSVLSPGERPAWSAREGIATGTAARPGKASWSTRREPRTIHCLEGRSALERLVYAAS